MVPPPYSADSDQHSRLLADASRLLVEAGLEPEEIMQSLCRSCAGTIADFAVIFAIDADGETMSLAAYADKSEAGNSVPDRLLRDWKPRVGEGLTGGVVSSGETLFVPVVDQEEALRQVPDGHRPHVAAVPTYSYIIAPIKARNQAYGTLTVGRSVPGHPFTSDDAHLIEEMALRTALMTAAAREHRRALEEIARRTEVQAALADSEARYKALADLSPQAILVNQGGAWAYANPAAAALLGAKDTSELLGRSPREFIHPDFHAAAQERSQRALHDSATNAPLEQYWLRVDGSRFDCEVSSAPIVWQGERAVLLVCSDITERKRAEESLREASRLKDEFLGLVSHELRTPLTSIYGYAALLARTPDLSPEFIRESLTDLLDESVRLNRIVENMLVLGRIQAGQVLEMEPLLASKELDAGVEKFLRKHADANITVRHTEDETVVLGVQEYFDQVLENLLSNAYKYSPPRGAITVSTEVRGGLLWVDVADRGPGITDAEKVFGAFVRESGAAMVAGGLGLGLTVCKRLVDAMGGSIQAAAREGGGTTVSFSLRMASAAD